MDLLKKPKKLEKGDTVAAISLSWGGAAAFPERYALGKKRLEETFGVRVVETRHALRDPAWLAANPKARADDLMEAFADPSIKGIFSIIGGDDSLRLIPYVDVAVLRHNPKPFLGYSDTTVSHFLCMKAGFSSFYGASILAEFAENVSPFSFTVQAVERALFSTAPIGEIFPAKEWTGAFLDWGVPENALIRRERYNPLGYKVLQGEGVVQGRLIGGCVEVLDWLRGTPLWPASSVWEGALLFLETSEENPSVRSFLRLMRPLAVMGVFHRVAGVLLGRPMSAPGLEAMTVYDRALQTFLREECALPSLPLMTQLDFGHSAPQTVLPYGALAKIDCNRGTFSLLEPGVV